MNFEQWATVILEDHLEELEDGSIMIKEGFEHLVDESLFEGLTRKIVIRKGKPTIKYVNPNPQAYKIVNVNGRRELRKMTPRERQNRKKGAMQMAKKNATKSKINTQKRLKTMGLKSKG